MLSPVSIAFAVVMLAGGAYRRMLGGGGRGGRISACHGQRELQLIWGPLLRRRSPGLSIC